MKPLKKILIADDDPDILTVIETCLKTIPGVEILRATNGEEAVDLAMKNDPDLFLLDVVMPVMDGLEALKALKMVPKFSKKPVIFLTAKNQKHEVEAYLKAGANEVIPKPFEPLTLPKTVESLWGKFGE